VDRRKEATIMTLFAVVFFVVAALVLILGLMMRPLTDQPSASARKSGMQKSSVHELVEVISRF